MRKPEWTKGFAGWGGIKSLLNIACYQWKRTSWVVSPRAWVNNIDSVDIDRPIFLVGNQGDGLSLVSRMIRRNHEVVSVTGGSDYWSGADEMQRVMAPRLPQNLRLTGNVLKGEPPHQEFSPPRSWTYASSDLLHAYRMTDDDYTIGMANSLRRIIAESIARFKKGGKGARFVDKSQVFTVKISLIDALLKETNPHFVLITRNPYVSCYRAATGGTADMRRYADTMPFSKRFETCIQHWKNSISCALEDAEEVENFKQIKFEDFLVDTEGKVKELSSFLGLQYTDRMIPSKNDKIPLGTRFRNRWYPIREDVNEKYLHEMDLEHIEKIHNNVSQLAKKVGYSRPSKGQ